VGDHQDGQPPIAQPFDQVQNLGGLLDAQGRRRLVQDDQARVAEEGAGDRH
jgi:hypothetical protein